MKVGGRLLYRRFAVSLPLSLPLLLRHLVGQRRSSGFVRLKLDARDCDCDPDGDGERDRRPGGSALEAT